MRGSVRFFKHPPKADTGTTQGPSLGFFKVNFYEVRQLLKKNRQKWLQVRVIAGLGYPHEGLSVAYPAGRLCCFKNVQGRGGKGLPTSLLATRLGLLPVNMEAESRERREEESETLPAGRHKCIKFENVMHLCEKSHFLRGNRKALNELFFSAGA